MPLLELRSPFPVSTPVGNGYAILVESDAHDMWWTVILDNGAIVTLLNNRIKARKSWSHGRGVTDAEFKEIINGSRHPPAAPSGPRRDETTPGPVAHPGHEPDLPAELPAGGAWHLVRPDDDGAGSAQTPNRPWHSTS